MREFARSGYLWLIEWPDRETGRLPLPDLSVTLSAPGGHEINVTGTSALGEVWVSLVKRRARNVDYGTTYFLNSMIKKAFQLGSWPPRLPLRGCVARAPNYVLTCRRPVLRQLTLDVAAPRLRKCSRSSRPRRVVIDLAHTGLVRDFGLLRAPASFPISGQDTRSRGPFE